MSVDPRLVRALRVQLDRRPAPSASVGWKVGAGNGNRIGLEAIAAGRLTSASLLAPGATYAAGGDDLRADGADRDGAEKVVDALGSVALEVA